MSAEECLNRLSNTKALYADLKYCLVDENKNPYKFNGERARVNKYDDFVSFEEISKSPFLKDFKGLGISVQASDITGIDIDHCIKEPLNFDTCDEMAKSIVNLFKNKAYIEFSFSGTGLRILFKFQPIKPYREQYYIKNSNIGVEFYQPKFDDIPSNRFLTITGNAIYNNHIDYIDKEEVFKFLDTYMKRKDIKSSIKVQEIKDDRDLDTLLKEVRKHYRKDYSFMEDWFCDGKHPANPQASDESERDYRIIDYLYTNITTDKNKLKKLFEESPFFKTKDFKHKNKWEYNNNRYYNYQYEAIRKKHL